MFVAGGAGAFVCPRVCPRAWSPALRRGAFVRWLYEHVFVRGDGLGWMVRMDQRGSEWKARGAGLYAACHRGVSGGVGCWGLGCARAEIEQQGVWRRVHGPLLGDARAPFLTVDRRTAVA